MVELCQGVLDGVGTVVVAILNVKWNAMSCGAYRRVRMLEHAIKIVEKVLEKRLWRYGESGRYAIWFYARQRNDRYSVHFEVVTRGVLSPLVVAIVVDVITESVRNGLMSEMLYAVDLVLTSETMEGLKEKFWKWKEKFESKG